MDVKFGSQYDKSKLQMLIRTDGNTNTELEVGDQHDEASREVEIHDGARVAASSVHGIGVSQVSDEELPKRTGPSRATGVWMLGIFWIFALVVIVVLFAALGDRLSLRVLPYVLLGSLAAYAMMGALVLRFVGKLGEESFLKLIGMALKNPFAKN